MAFPVTPLDIQADLKIDGVWQDITADVLTRDLMTIVRGRPDEGVRSDPGKCKMSFNNGASNVAPGISGRYSPGNPNSDLYGFIGRNTEFRVHLPAAEAHLELDGDVTGTVSTPHAAALNITGDIDIRVEIDADLTDTARSSAILGKWGTTAADRSWTLRCIAGSIILQWLDSSATPWIAFTDVNQFGGAALRVTLDVDNGASGYTARFYQADSIAGPWTQLGGDLIGSSTTSLQATTSALQIGPTDTTTTPTRLPFIGTATRFQVRSGIDGTLVADADFRALADGATSFTDSTGRLWTVNGTAKVRKREDRLLGEISAWPPRWDVSGNDRWVPVEASGVLRRYGRPGAPLASTLRRRIPSGNPAAYWPMEEGSGATQAYSPLAGVAPMTVTGLQFAGIDTLPGSSPLPTLGATAAVQGTVPTTTATGWHVEMVYRLEALPASQQQIARVRVAGSTMLHCNVLVGTGGIRVEARDGDDVVLGSVNYTDADALAAFIGGWNRLQIYTSSSGGTTFLHASWRRTDGLAAYWFARMSFTGTPGRATRVIGSWGSDFQGMGLGHIAVWNGVAASLTSPYRPAITTYESADDGFLGEAAGKRMLRLASEENIPLSVRGIVAAQAAIGAQRPAQLLDLLGQAADSDGGILMEHRSRLALRYRGRATMYNQAPALTLDYTADGEVAPPLEPLDDDAEVANDVTVQRIDGSFGRAVLEEGPLSVQAPPDGVGLYAVDVQLSLGADSQTEQIAGWRLHLGSWDAPRYPVVHVNLAAAPHLIDTVMAVDQGDLIRITNPPEDLPPGDINLLVQGYTESFDQYAWDIYFTCTPADPWTVAELAVFEDFEDTTFEISTTNGGDLPWTRTNTQAHTGSWSMRSGAITHNQTSDLIVAVPAGKTELRFWYWTSSEASGSGFEGDRLLVLRDGVQVLRAQGTTPWTQAIVDVTGASAVTFRYAKDNSASSGSDFVAIDNVSFTGRGPSRLNTDGSKLLTAVTNTATQLLVGSAPGPEWTRNPAMYPFNVKAGGEEMQATAIASWARDAFGRTVSGAWGSTDTGQAWFVIGGTIATDFAVGSGYGQHILTTTNASRRCGIDHTHPDVDVVVSVTTSATATGGSLYGGPVARYVDADNLYMCRIEFTTSNAILIDVRKRVAATETSIGTATTSITHAAGTFVRCRLQVIGSTIRAKVWPASAAEPQGWHVELVDTSITTSNFVGARSISAAGNTNVNPQVRYDDFEVLNPQTMTVVRSVNGVVKAHAAGTSLGLAQPAHLAL